MGRLCVEIFILVGVSMPSFWLGLVLIYIFGLKLGLVPIATSRITPIGVILPAATLAVVIGSKYMRQVRLVILEEWRRITLSVLVLVVSVR